MDYSEDQDYLREIHEEHDRANRKLRFLLVLGVCAFLLLTLLTIGITKYTDAKATCETNPRVLYGQECTTKQECLKSCVWRTIKNG